MWFFNKSKKEKEFRKLSDLSNNEVFTFNYNEYGNNIGDVKCLNNNKKDKEIYIEITFSNNTKSLQVVKYSHYYFRNFRTLNPINKIVKIKEKTFFEKLDDLRVIAEKKEDFETAQIIKESIVRIKMIKL